jgi:hypothetical protein
MTPEQERTFREQGILLLPGGLPRSQVEPLRQRILDDLKRLNVRAAGKTVSAQFSKLPAFQQITRLSAALNADGLHARLTSEVTRSAIESLSESRFVAAQAQFLVSLPNQGAWRLDALNWHTDLSATPSSPLPGIQLFALIDDVKPQGGATLAIAGSHLRNAREIRQILRRSGDLAAELRRENLPLVEMHGKAGDVYLMDMRVLHTPSINSTNRLRMMATVRHLPQAG